MIRRRRRTAIAGALVAIIGLGGVWLARPDGDASGGPEDPVARKGRTTFASSDPVARACELKERYIERLWRGSLARRSEDIVIVPNEPNYWGSFEQPSHTGPWDYLQEVPLVLYGPGYVPAEGRQDGPVTLADIYGTMGELLDVDLPSRPGGVLEEAVDPARDGAPKLVLFLMWDGVGTNVLQRHPDEWPNLRDLEDEGVSYTGATVGSSPSVTPSTHATLGTGSFPRSHGVTGVHYRTSKGTVRRIFERGDPRGFGTSTFADEVDVALGNEPKVGLLAWQIARPNNEGARSWESNHLTMLGHGTAFPGGDADEMGLIGDEGAIDANPEFFSLPSYLNGFPGLEGHITRLDLEDGEADGEWMGHNIDAAHDNPAWVRFQTDVLTTMLAETGYGTDDVPDLFFTTFKATDLAGHHFFMDSPEMAATVKAQDDALGDIIEYLDQNVEDYVVVVSADHGHTPSFEQTGAWPISTLELEKDVDSYFDVPQGTTMFTHGSAGGYFLDRQVTEKLQVTPEEVAAYMNAYTISDNWAGDDLPPGYADRAEEPVFSAAFSPPQMPEIMKCAFGSKQPPRTNPSEART